MRLCESLKVVGKCYGHGGQCGGRSERCKGSKELGTLSKPQRLSAPTEKQQTPHKSLSGRQMFLLHVWQSLSAQVLAAGRSERKEAE